MLGQTWIRIETNCELEVWFDKLKVADQIESSEKLRASLLSELLKLLSRLFDYLRYEEFCVFTIIARLSWILSN